MKIFPFMTVKQILLKSDVYVENILNINSYHLNDENDALLDQSSKHSHIVLRKNVLSYTVTI